MQIGNEFTKLAKMLEPSVVNITADYTPKLQEGKSRKQSQGDDDGDDDSSDLFRRFFGGPGGGRRFLTAVAAPRTIRHRIHRG